MSSKLTERPIRGSAADSRSGPWDAEPGVLGSRTAVFRKPESVGRLSWDEVAVVGF